MNTKIQTGVKSKIDKVIEMEMKENYTEDAQGIQNDEVATITEEQMLDNLKNDVKAYTKSLEDAKKSKEDYIEQYEIDKKIWDIVSRPGALEKLSPIYAFEKDPEFVKLQEQKQAYKIRQDRAIGDGQLEQFDIQIKNTEEALERAKKKLEIFGGASNE